MENGRLVATGMWEAGTPASDIHSLSCTTAASGDVLQTNEMKGRRLGTPNK